MDDERDFRRPAGLFHITTATRAVIRRPPKLQRKMGRTIVGSVRTPRQLIRQYSVTANAMHKLQFARGIGQREILRANTLPSLTRAKVGCLARIHIYEENARFILLAILLVAYMCVGAALFHWLEYDNELMERDRYFKLRDRVNELYCAEFPDPTRRYINCTLLYELLDMRGKLSAAGLLNDRPSFDLAGAFYFAGTVISTIGECCMSGGHLGERGSLSLSLSLSLSHLHDRSVLHVRGGHLGGEGKPKPKPKPKPSPRSVSAACQRWAPGGGGEA
jgi:hypothetical protein